MQKAACEFDYHARAHERGFFSFASLDDVNEKLTDVGKFEVVHEIDTLSFVAAGFPDREIKAREASNWVQAIFRKAWEAHAKRLGLLSFAYSSDIAFHVSGDQARIGQRFSWGTQGEKRSSMLRNIAKNTSGPSVLRPFLHFGPTITSS